MSIIKDKKNVTTEISKIRAFSCAHAEKTNTCGIHKNQTFTHGA